LIRATGPDPLLIIVPAFNEEAAVGGVVRAVHEHVPGVPVLVIDDCSGDNTVNAARAAGAEVLPLAHHLGLGGCVQAGYKLAHELGFEYVIRVDGDGQHDARDIPRLLEPLDPEGPPQVVVGARFAGEGDIAVPRARRLAMRLLARYLSRMTGTRLTDVTSGFRAHNRAALALFARTYPADYLSDTVESLVIASRAGARITQVPVAMRPRTSGRPSQSGWRAAGYLLRVVLTLALAIIRRPPVPTEPEEGSP